MQVTKLLDSLHCICYCMDVTQHLLRLSYLSIDHDISVKYPPAFALRPYALDVSNVHSNVRQI